MLDPASLLLKHRGRGVFLDTNLLVLYIVGLVDRAQICRFKRCQNFSEEDFDLVLKLIALLGPLLYTTPHILSQTSDLTDLSGSYRDAALENLRLLTSSASEQYDPAKNLTAGGIFGRFGLADAAVEAVCQRNVLIITDDLPLYVELATRRLEALNFNYLRPLNWRIW